MAGPPLWLVRNGERRVFLFAQGPWGVRDDDPWFPAAAAEAFEASRGFWHEVPDDPALTDGANVARFGLDPTGLDARLDDGVKAELARAADVVGVDARTLAGCRPWLAAQLLDGALKATVAGPLVDVEGVLTERARVAGKRVGAEFDDAEALLSTFAALGQAEVELLSWTADRVLAGAPEMRRQAEAWMRGDLRVFEEDLGRTRARWPRLHESLFRARNDAWLPRIETMLVGEHDVFVVMGMGHLVNDDGVVNLVRQRGADVERIE